MRKAATMTVEILSLFGIIASIIVMFIYIAKQGDSDNRSSRTLERIENGVPQYSYTDDKPKEDYSGNIQTCLIIAVSLLGVLVICEISTNICEIGERLQEQAQRTQYQSQQYVPPQTVMPQQPQPLCPKCGKPLIMNMGFCGGCGSPNPYKPK